MEVRLNSMIRYDQGLIQPTMKGEAAEPRRAIVDAKIIEDRIVGWGDSDAVVYFDDQYYLATKVKE